MGALFLDGIQVGDDGRLSGRAFGPDPDAAGRLERECAAMERAGAEIDMQAVCRTHHALKDRARRYLRRPASMGAIDARLPGASWQTMLAIADHHLDIEARRRRRLVGLGGEVPFVNAMAVRLAARWLRRFGERADMLVAAE